jgi:hypothetical protein
MVLKQTQRTYHNRLLPPQGRDIVHRNASVGKQQTWIYSSYSRIKYNANAGRQPHSSKNMQT